MGDKRAKTELFSKWGGGNLIVADQGLSTGARFWVSSDVTGAADSTGHGKSPLAPFATLDYASTQCTANAGDIIYVMAGHTETILLATTCNLAIAGVKVVGLGSGADRPTFTFGTNNAATMTIDAASVTVQNLVLVCGKDGQTVMLDVNADDATIIGCEFRNDATYQAVTMLDINGGANGADRTKVLGNKFVSITIGATAAIEIGEVEDGVEIVGNYIYGDFSSAGIHNPTGKVATNLLIKDNIVANTNTGEHAIELVSACTGQCVDNRLYGDTWGTILDPGSLMCNGNLATDAIDQAGVPVPVTPASADFDTENFAADWFDSTMIDAYAYNSTAFATDAFTSDKFADDVFNSSHFAADSFNSTMFQHYNLDSTVFDTDAFTSDKFADDVFNSSHIAADTFDSTHFAADAFNSTMIQDYNLSAEGFDTDCFDSNKFAADTFDSTHFAANTFDSTMVIDGAFDSAVFSADAVTKIGGGGILVNRATADTFDTAVTPLFTIGTGKVLLLGVIGTVTTNIENKTCSINLQANGTTGTTSDICAALDIDNAQAGTTWGITGTAATLLVAAVGGGAPWPATPLVLEVGTLDLNCTADHSGSAKWDIWYIPLEAGATVVAA